jgi:hypothetical protein
LRPMRCQPGCASTVATSAQADGCSRS